MGMYTELVLKCEVVDDLPESVKAVLEFLFNGGKEPAEIPAHDFFKCGRWRMIGKCSSYYHTPFALSRFSDGHIFSRSDLKNYDNEIEKFLAWVRPYLDVSEWQDVIGWTWYEKAEEPTLIHANPGHHAPPQSGGSVHGVVGSLNQEET